MSNNVLLKVENISKQFPGVKALDNVSFEVEKGSIHALIGENGAGKSTLIKILSGIYTKDAGKIYLDGEEVIFNNPIDAKKAGIAVVHQELKLVETLTIAENVFLGNLLYKNNGLVDWPTMKKKAREFLSELGINMDVDTPVGNLTVAQQQMVEICKAINNNSKLLIMDEPTAVLTSNEQKTMFEMIRKLNAKGLTIIYISHRLEEIFSLANRVTVLRDGILVDTCNIEDVDRQKLVFLMVGREVGEEYPKRDSNIGDKILEVKNINEKGVLHNVSFNLRKGEVVGFAGLVGSGRTETVRALLGIDKAQIEEITYYGQNVKFNSFIDAINAGIGLVPENRKTQGLIQSFSVRDNASMVSIDKFVEHGLINFAKEYSKIEEYTKKVNLKAPSLDTEVRFLSGGNQQKVVISKWLMQDCKILILDEPTRGIDVGAKSEIYDLINQLIENGVSVIMISSEMPELLGMCDRIYVMHEGGIVGELDGKEATQEKIMSLCI